MKTQDIQNLFKHEIVSKQKLSQLAWTGLPQEHRSRAWKILINYLPTSNSQSEPILKSKREEYKYFKYIYFESKDQNLQN